MGLPISLRRTGGAALAALLAGCALPPAEFAAAPRGVASHVVVVSVDGLRPDAIESSGARHLVAMMREGTHAADARTIQPSLTLPSHTSMLTGVPPSVHGITWNDDSTDVTGVVAVPTVFEVAHDAGRSTAAIFGKVKFRHLVRPGSLDWVAVPPNRREIALAPQTVEQVEALLRFRRPHLLFIHLSDPDVNGHAFGWMSASYRRWGVRRADAALARIRRAVRGAYGDDVVLIVTADHGGSGRHHREVRPENWRIPWIAAGRGVVPGTITRTVNTYDTAATALWLLGVPIPPDWAGRPVTEAFVAQPAGAAGTTAAGGTPQDRSRR